MFILDILPSRKQGRDSQSSRTWVPASLATGFPGCHSGLLLHSPPSGVSSREPRGTGGVMNPDLLGQVYQRLLSLSSVLAWEVVLPYPKHPNKDSPLIPPSEGGGSSRLDG